MDPLIPRDPRRGWGSHVWIGVRLRHRRVAHWAFAVGDDGERPAGYRTRCGIYIPRADAVDAHPVTCRSCAPGSAHLTAP